MTPTMTINCSAVQVPLLVACDWCSGAGFEPTEEGGLIPCGICEGGGYSPVIGDIGRTKSVEKRTYVYNPGLRRLVTLRGRKKTIYQLAFMPAKQPDAQSFQCVNETSGEVYYLYVTKGAVRCDCSAQQFRTSAKCNARDHAAGEPTYHTRGCVHADCLDELLRLGLMEAK